MSGGGRRLFGFFSKIHTIWLRYPPHISLNAILVKIKVVFQKGSEKNEQNTFWDLGGVKGLDFASNPFSSGVPMYGLHDLNHKIVE